LLKLHPLHRALVLAFAAPAMSVLAAETDTPPDAGPTRLAQAQGPSASSGAGETIVITGQREHYRGDVPLEEIPQSVQVISAEMMKQVGAVKLNDVLDLAAGVARQNTYGGVWDGFAIRGFVGDPNLPSGYLVNGFNGGRGFGGLRDTSSIEKIEILKGPGSALFGRSEPGGTVSITTKKPQFKPEGSITLAAGSYDFKRVEGDYTTPLGDSTAVRINGAYEDADSFRETVHSKRAFASPSIIQRIGSNTQIWYELEWSKQEIPFDRGVVARNGVLGIIPNSRYLGEPGDGPTIAKVLGHQAELQHIFAKNWVLLIGGAARNTKLDGIGQNPEFAAARNPFFTDGQTLARQRRFTNYESDDNVGRAEVSGGFKTGSIGHHILFGADYESFKLDRLQTRYRPPAFNASTSLAVSNAVNIFNPIYGNAPAANQNVFNDTEKDKAYGVYLTDQVDITGALKLRVGARYDSFKQHIDNRLAAANLQPPEQDVTATSPSIGVTYKISDALSVYTAFAKGFRPQTGFDVNRKPFEPEETKSGEVGLKYQLMEGDLSGNLAVFKMKKTNVLTADPVNQGQSIAIGGAESKGVEFDLTGRLPGRVTLLIAYAYTDAIASSSVRDVDFGRVVAAGDPLINIPKHNANVLVLKDFDVADRKLTIGGGVKYVGRRLGETGTKFFLPGYTLIRLQATYEVMRNLSVTAEVTNLTDKVYYPASYAAIWVAPGEPRQFQLRATYRF
jgi:iron complex outermembrane receptor protein